MINSPSNRRDTPPMTHGIDDSECGPVDDLFDDPGTHFLAFVASVVDLLCTSAAGTPVRRKRGKAVTLTREDVLRQFAFEIMCGIHRLPQEEDYFTSKIFCMRTLRYFFIT